MSSESYNCLADWRFEGSIMFVAMALTLACLSSTKIMPISLQIPDTEEVVAEGLRVVIILFQFT